MLIKVRNKILKFLLLMLELENLETLLISLCNILLLICLWHTFVMPYIIANTPK